MSDLFSPFPWSELLAWYEKYGRHDLPWRVYELEDKKGKEADNYERYTLPYRVWISEIFLQQTQVSRVVSYFDRVIERFPTIEDLAGADYETFFPYYQGLGYYSRARNMLQTATIIRDEYEGVFPDDLEKLSKLPGVGPYTARAILAFGYGEPYLAWDTNLEKVFSRYYHGDKNRKLSLQEKNEVEKDFRKFVSELETGNLRLETIRDANNALMDFSSLIDLKNPSAIDWDHYPIKSGRFYETRGSLEPREVKKSVTFPIPDATVIVILHKDHRVYYSERGKVKSEKPTAMDQGMENIQTIDFFPFTSDEYAPFVLAPPLHRDTRKYVQDYFREKYGLELSVRPPHKKWFSDDGRPYIAVNAQIQAGVPDFREYPKSKYTEYSAKIL